jgi:hypothetical protein
VRSKTAKRGAQKSPSLDKQRVVLLCAGSCWGQELLELLGAAGDRELLGTECNAPQK